MPLKGRVGRHASDGRQCQNWKADQQTVIDLLNRIPVADGGTGGSLGGRVVAGLASARSMKRSWRSRRSTSPDG